MSKYRTYNWPELFEEFESSGLTQAEFCSQRDINPKYFSRKLSTRQTTDNNKFARVELPSATSSLSHLVLEVGDCKIHCPDAMPLSSFISLVRSLA